MTIDYSKITKAPTPEHLKFKYTVSKADIDKANAIAEAMGRMPYSAIDRAKFEEIVRAETDRVIAEGQREVMELLTTPIPPPDPLDVKHDGVTLGRLLECDERCRRENGSTRHLVLLPAQRAAVSAHWSAELRAKVAASKERDRNQVRVDPQDEP